MQVLQRIDLFTDTGLRTQLGERLQPIVDRASADLVATINQHVGELLRAYVAEAIEREIDSWRRCHVTIDPWPNLRAGPNTGARLDPMKSLQTSLSTLPLRARPYAYAYVFYFWRTPKGTERERRFPATQGFHQSGGPKRVA